MKKKYLFLILFIVISQITEAQIVIEAPKPDEPFNWKLPSYIGSQQFSKKLKSMSIDSSKILFTNRIDTFKIGEKHKELFSPAAFTFTEFKTNNQYLAIQTADNWILLDYQSTILSSPNSYDIEWLKFDNYEYPLLLIKHERKVNVKSEAGRESYSKGYSREWKKVEVLSLFNPMTLQMVLDNIITGYQYGYANTDNYEIKREEGKASIHGYGNKVEYRTNLWYDFIFNILKGELQIEKRECKMEIIRNASKKFTDDDYTLKHGIKAEDEKELKSISDCESLFHEGTYTFNGEKFVKKD